MRSRRLPLALAGTATLLATAFLVGSPTEAQDYQGSVVITGECAGIEMTDTGPHIVDRDNTGTGAEVIIVRAYDGDDNLLLDYTYDAVLHTYVTGIGNFLFDVPPVSNPISVVIGSAAGNGLPEVLDAPRLVSCDSLPPATVPTPVTRPEVVTTPSVPVTATTRPATTTTTTTRPVTTTPDTTPTTGTAPRPVGPQPGPVLAPVDTRNCTEIGHVNITAANPLYRPDLDSDGDGIACESGTAPAARPIAANASYTG